MHCGGRSVGSARPITARRSQLSKASFASFAQTCSLSARSAANITPRQRRHTSSRASSNSQASVTLKAPGSSQQPALQQQDLKVPRSLLIAVDYTTDAEQALQWALDFVVKPGTQSSLVTQLSRRSELYEPCQIWESAQCRSISFCWKTPLDIQMHCCR